MCHDKWRSYGTCMYFKVYIWKDECIYTLDSQVVSVVNICEFPLPNIYTLPY
jgi:hypothetical protein